MASYDKAAITLLEQVREEERKRLYKLVKGELNRWSKSLDALFMMALPDKQFEEFTSKRTASEGREIKEGLDGAGEGNIDSAESTVNGNNKN